MPRLSAGGLAVMGINGVITSVMGATPAPLVGSQGGNWDWLADNIIAGQASIPAENGGAWYCYSVNLDDDTVTLLAASGATFFAAGGGNWMKQFGGVQTNIPGIESLPIAGQGSISREGILAINTQYDSAAGVSVYSAVGALLQQISVTLFGYGAAWIRCRGGLLSFPTASGFPLLSAATAQPITGYVQQVGISKLVPVLFGTTPVVVEYNGDASTWSLRRADQATGLVVDSSGTPVYNMDAVAKDGKIRLAWSTGEGEAPGDLVLLDVDTSTGETQRGTVSGSTVVWAAGPTLQGTTFNMTSAGKTYPPWQHPISDKNGKTTRPWQEYFSTLGQGVQQAQTAIRSQAVSPSSGLLNAPFILSGTPSPSMTQARQLVDSDTVELDYSVPGVVTANATTTATRALVLAIASLRA